jgi:hypothetical protein
VRCHAGWVPPPRTQGRVEIEVLGPVAVRAAGVPIPLDRPLEHALAARLALARGAPVPDDRLVRDLWGDAEQSRPVERLRVLASRPRRSLGEHAAALTRSPGGYALAGEPTDLAAAEAAAERLTARHRKLAAFRIWNRWSGHGPGRRRVALRRGPGGRSEPDQRRRRSQNPRGDPTPARALPIHQNSPYSARAATTAATATLAEQPFPRRFTAISRATPARATGRSGPPTRRHGRRSPAAPARAGRRRYGRWW